MIKQKLLTILAFSIPFNCCFALFAYSQNAPATGSIKLVGQIQFKAGEKRKPLDRKRFYLVRGGLEDNRALIKRLEETEILSRDCYYQDLKASPEFMCWLKTEDYNCESPYCRDISLEDIRIVPEFQIAFNKGLRQFGRRSEIARKWITTNLPPPIRDGFYNQQKTTLKNLRAEAQPIQSSMTDSKNGWAYFIDIPLNLKTGEKKETFTVSNLLPVEIGNKSYVWVCEIDIGTEKLETLSLPNAKNKKCEVFIKDLKICKTDQCGDIFK